MVQIYIIEGEIGAGKTELIKALTEEYKARDIVVCTIFEPVNDWVSTGALSLFYSDPIKYAYAFQTYVFSSRINVINELWNPNADIVLIERSPATDMVFWKLQNPNPVEDIMYKSWCNTWEKLLPFDLTSVTALYIHADLDICMTRMIQRNRNGEGGVSRDYQMKLRVAHEEFLMGDNRTCPYKSVVILEPTIANLDWRETSLDKKIVIDSIISLMHS